MSLRKTDDDDGRAGCGACGLEIWPLDWGLGPESLFTGELPISTSLLW
jgi:hypothetical protein